MTNKELRRKKLADLIAEYGSQKAFGDAVGKDPAMFSQILNGTRNLGDKLALDLEEKLEKPRGWFDLQDSAGIVIRENLMPYNAMPLPARRLAPVISYVQAGNWAELVDAYPMGEGFEHIDIDAKWSANSFVLKVRGDSMLPTLTEGAYIVVDPAVEWMHNRIVVVRQNGDTEVTVKRLVKDGDTYYLKPDNTNYRPMEMGKDAHICGVVVEQIMKFI